MRCPWLKEPAGIFGGSGLLAPTIKGGDQTHETWVPGASIKVDLLLLITNIRGVRISGEPHSQQVLQQIILTTQDIFTTYSLIME